MEQTWILRQKPDDADNIEEIARAISRLPERCSVAFYFSSSTDLSNSVEVHTWVGRDADEDIEVTDDHGAHLRYITLRLGTEERLRCVAEALSEVLDFISMKELIAAVRAAPHDPRALYQLGIAAGNYDAEAACFITNALKSPDQTLRRHAAKAAGMAAWPELADEVKAALDVEQDQPTRLLLNYAASRCGRASV